MIQIENRPYELSLWEDIVTVGEGGSISTTERRLAIIGSQGTTSPIAAFDILLNKKINGEKTLTFSISSSYYDEEEQSQRVNPYLTKLTNERKVKLKWEDKWYDFVIKNVSEDSKQRVFTYTAKDQHVLELAKSGYNIQFDKELENNTLTPREFITAILDGTNWTVGDCDTFLEYTTEAVYEYVTNQELTLHNLLDGTTTKVKAGKRVFVPYSIIQNQIARCQVLYGGEDSNTNMPSRDDEGTLNGKIFKNYYFDTTYENGQPIGLNQIALRDDCRGRHYVRRPQTVYDSKIDRYVNVYKDGAGDTYYGFVKTEYLDREITKNLISNSENFTNLAGWKPVGTEGGGNEGYAQLETNPPIESGFNENYINTEFLLTIPKKIFNTGFFDSRGTLASLVEGHEYILDIEYSRAPGEGRITEILVKDYEIANGSYIPKPNGTTYIQKANISGNIPAEGEVANIIRTELTWIKTLSEEEIRGSKIGIFLTTNGNSTKIKRIALYRKLLDETGALVQPNQVVFENKEIASEKYVYYKKTKENYDMASLKPDYEGFVPNNNYVLQYEDTYQKKRSLTASKSNRFNLLQKVCETFEGWLDIQVSHDITGQIATKKIGLKEFIGRENFAGFKYGVNLDKIKRTVDSSQIVTKMIVEPNANEFAPNGFCTIARSSLNPSGTNVVYNFDYYISQGILSQETAQSALNAYNENIKNISKQITDKQNEKINKEKFLVQIDAEAFFESEHAEAAQKGLLEAEQDLFDLTKHNYAWFVLNSDPDADFYEDYNKLIKNSQCLGYLREIIRYRQVIDQYQETDPWGPQVVAENLKHEIAAIDREIDGYIAQQKQIETEFQNKLSRFIQEGNWISEEYTDDDLYYIDSLSTLYTSSRPRVSYNIDVFDIGGIEGYENYHFEVGDKTFVQDPELFGWVDIDEVRTPRKEEVVISEKTTCVDNITKNSIKIQNYKTQFEDLFQRIAAATEALQYNTGRYEKFSKAVDSDGAISYQALQEAVNKNGLAISGAGHQTVSCDEKGIIATDDQNPSNQVRIIGGGVFLTDDGGATWSTGITGEGINADTITSGIVNTGKVNIMSGGAKTHVWDDKGITSYKTNYNSDGAITSVDPSTFVRQDEFGIYGIKNNATFNARAENRGDPIGKIENEASYALTWDGFMLKTGEGNERVEIDSEDDIAIYDKNNKQCIKIGRVSDDAYGMRITDSANSDKFAYIGIAPDVVDGKKAIIAAQSNENKRFIVLEDGTMYADGAIIDGDVHITDGYLHLMSNDANEDGKPDGQVIIDPSGVGGTEYLLATFKNGEPVLVVSKNGNAEFAGTIYANGGLIGGWHLVDQALSSKENIEGGKGIYLSPIGTEYKMGKKAEKFVILAGENFGVTDKGIVYAKNYQLSGGTIENTELGESVTIDWSKVNVPTVEEYPTLQDISNAATEAQSNAQTAVNTATNIGNELQGSINKAQEAADGAQKKADEANNTAINANTVATGAQNTANTANNTANGAKETADTLFEQVNGEYGLKAQINAHAGLIAAKVSKTSPEDSTTGFGWNLNENSFTLTSYDSDLEDKNVFVCDRDGLKINGHIIAGSGLIGDFDIIDGGLGFSASKFPSAITDEGSHTYSITSIGNDSDGNGIVDILVSEYSATAGNKHHYSFVYNSSLKGFRFISIPDELESNGTSSLYVVKSLPGKDNKTNGNYDYYYRIVLNPSAEEHNWIPGTILSEFFQDGETVYLIVAGCTISPRQNARAGFQVTNSGEIATNNAKIGSWTIDDNVIYSQDFGHELKMFTAYFGDNYGTPESEDYRIVVGASGKDQDKGFRVKQGGDLYLSNGPQITSDKKTKYDIQQVPKEYSTLFDNLKPVRFKLKTGTSNRYHTGLIAQDLEEAIQQANLTNQDVAALCIDKYENAPSQMSIRYEELIALCIKEIQDLKKEVSVLKTQIEQLQS